jgi:hypothetical protein
MPNGISVIPMPAGWPNIKTTYEQQGSLREKIKTVYGTPPQTSIPKAAVLAGIDYWIARLNQDRYCIDHGLPLVPY